MKTLRWCLAAAAALLPLAASAQMSNLARVPRARLNRLTHGINLGVNRYRPEFTLDPALAAALREAGIRHVRLPYDPAMLFDEAHPGTPKPDGLKRLDAMLDTLLAEKIGVVLEMHDPDKRLWNDAEYGKKFVTFWEAIARHVSRRDPNYMFLETANEPLSDTPEYWNELQGRMLAAMRKGAPHNTFLASGNMLTAPGQWEQVKALDTLKAYPDRNIVYTFHFYEPFLFTHQGATWGWDMTALVKNIPYPSSPEAVAPVAAATPERARQFVTFYGGDRWDRARIRNTMLPYVEWAKRNKAFIHCGEFGVYKQVSPELDRMRWHIDVRTVLEDLDLPWTMWDDGGGFGVVRVDGRNWTLDTDVLRALNLPIPTRTSSAAP